MPNIVITHEGSNTHVVSDGTDITWVTADATVTAVDDTSISVTVGGVPIITMDINSIVTIDGAKPYGNAEDVVTQITNAASPGGLGYLVYTALLTQTGTDAPVATVLENTLGGTVVWTRDAAGVYTGTLAGAFTVNKTIIPPFTSYNGASIPTIPFSDGGSITGYYQLWANSVDTIKLNVFDSSFVGTDFSDITLSAETGDLLVDLKVYP